ncbi:MAG: calcium-translocating P-type ATPase, PMCA-type [Alphaproteobacteria bacterium]
MKAFTETKQQVLDELGVDERTGLTNEEAREREERFGRNVLTPPERETLFARVWAAATEPMILMLIIAAFIAFGVNFARSLNGEPAEYIECVGILAAVTLAVAITVVMEGRSAKAFEALARIREDVRVKVFRNAEVCQIWQKDVVAGDIVCIETGDKLPADGRLLESIALRADESSLTGESVPVKKSADIVLADEDTPVAERVNMLYSGSFITQGNGRMIVTAVGDRTEFGRIARELSSVRKGATPLQEKLAHLGKIITIWGASMAGLVFMIQVVMFVLNGTVSLATVSEAFITSIVLIVAAVPEGLPTIVAVSLAVNIIKMSRQNALVKKMIACETVGCINVICSDKTGTLTENRMCVMRVCGSGNEALPEEIRDRHILANFCVNGTAEIGIEDGESRFIGNPTECALLAAASKAGEDYRKFRKSVRPVYSYPFSSETKNMTTVIEGKDGMQVYTKGSPEKIMDMCLLTPQARRAAEERIRAFQEKAYRVIAFAHRKLEERPDFETQRAAVESGMTYDGFVALADPLRRDVGEAVECCRRAGIELKILTGDNIVTARAIAGELHLLGEGRLALEAREIDALNDEQLCALLPDIRVIARSTPLIKMRVVNALKSCGHVVAVTGDGVNDAPAIKNADVGVAMGISGTEVAKEASDVVLLDDSFSTIVKAVQWGRGIYENFQRFIQFQLTVNLSSVVVVLLSVLAGFKSPFTALQLLWVNIIMDGPPALTLGLEPIRGSLMNRKPTPRSAPIVTRGMMRRILVGGLFISAVFMAQTVWNILGCTPEQSGTVLFTLFVLFQLVNAFNCRELSDVSIFANFGRNRLMLSVFAATFVLQVIITQYGGALFGTVPLPPEMWGRIMLLSLSVIAVSEIFKFFRRFGQKEAAAASPRTRKEDARACSCRRGTEGGEIVA